MYKYFKTKLKEYIFVILTSTVLTILLTSKSLSYENIFIVNNIKIETPININFSREKYIDKAIQNSFEKLMSKILLSSDLQEVSNVNLKTIKNLIQSFQVLGESFLNNKYVATFKFFYNDNKIKKFLVKKNISFSQPNNITAVFFPVFFINDELVGLNENYFYKNWSQINIGDESISFILPIDDIDDYIEIEKAKNNIELLNIETLITKYNTKNFIFSLINYQNNNLNIFLKTKFNDNRINKNINFKLDSIKNEKRLELILEKLKTEILDIWKSENIINLSIPMSLGVKFKHKNLKELEKLKIIFNEVGLVKSSYVEEININYSTFNIDYFGNPNKLRSELLKFGYILKNEQSHWEIYLNE